MAVGSHVEIGDVQGVVLDEIAPGFDQVAYQFGEQAVVVVALLDRIAISLGYLNIAANQ